ncbi:hypothetical protein Mterra_00057 [Calidithermus terrae]|uniref:Uncharacterized protein n=1 Tax=Calidithermus terrae TaxID=1408545 RepID=A0A399F2K5_9DEIN|nr:hypothetical protein [Calidithermus terrae]RIH90977.1 hypothetical protein Mterra_00057 [Calidithermus terrae]
MALSVLAATAVDAMVVRVPADMRFMGRHVAGSPVTRFVKRHSSHLHEKWGKGLERSAKVTFDFAHHKAVAGLRPKVHRIMSPGHDPLLGAFYGIRDLMRGEATFFDKDGMKVVVTSDDDPLGFTAAMIRWLCHLFSDAFTKMGLPAPGFSALLPQKGLSPFKLRQDGDLVPWKDIARWMYAEGFDLRHFLTQGLTPATVELFIRGYWLLTRYNDGHDATCRRKLAVMLLASHSLVVGGNLLKVAVTRNPMHFNLAQTLRVGTLAASEVGRLVVKTVGRSGRIDPYCGLQQPPATRRELQ